MASCSLTADSGGFSLTGFATAACLYASAGLLVLSGQNANPVRGLVVSDPPTLLKLDRLNSRVSIVDKDGYPTGQFQRFWQRHCEAIESAFTTLSGQVAAIQAAYDAAAQANMAASNANNAVAVVQSLAEDVQTTVTSIEDGTYNFSQLTVGGVEFGNVGGNIGPLP